MAAPGQFDWYGNNLPGQEGTTKDYGFTYAAMNDKLVLRVTRYEGDIENDAYGDASFALLQEDRRAAASDDAAAANRQVRKTSSRRFRGLGGLEPSQ